VRDTHDSGMAAARIRLWLVAGIGAAGLLISTVAAMSAATRDGQPWDLAWVGLAVLPLFAVALWLVRRRPDHPQARRLLVVSASNAAAVGVENLAPAAYRHVGAGDWLVPVGVGYQYLTLVGAITGTLLIATYPDGVVERRWQRWLVPALWWQLALPPLLLIAAPDVVILPYLLDSPQPRVPSPFAVTWLAWAAPPLKALLLNFYGVMVGVAVLLARFVQADRAQRRRMRLLVYSVAASLAVLIVHDVLHEWGLPETSAWWVVVSVLAIPPLLMIPVSIVVGVLRYQLFDIDVVVRRSVVYGALSLGIAAVYVGLAAVLGLALSSEIPVALALVVTIIVALAFQPARRRLEALADRWVFGERVNRYQLLSSYGATLERMVDLTELLPTLATTVRRGLGAAWVRVSLSGEMPGSWLDEPRGVAGEPSENPAVIQELRRADDVLGRIECGAKPDGYDAADRELLATLAAQSATAIANVRLTAQLSERFDELSRSRARIVAAQDAERRRIERNIHDGVQQQVVALITKLRLARNRFGRGELADAEFVELQRDAREMSIDLRELAHGIHPPVLSDNGLVAAVEARAARLPLDVAVVADDALRAGRLAEDIEGAAYFVICEALTNVVKHAGATASTVELNATDGRLRLLVYDNGHGLGGDPKGRGLTNLRDRVEALGGQLDVDGHNGSGTRVYAELPLGERHA
jgi:signal transduction histidine kinase